MNLTQWYEWYLNYRLVSTPSLPLLALQMINLQSNTVQLFHAWTTWLKKWPQNEKSLQPKESFVKKKKSVDHLNLKAYSLRNEWQGGNMDFQLSNTTFQVKWHFKDIKMKPPNHGLFLQCSISPPKIKSFPYHCQWNFILAVALVLLKSQSRSQACPF